MNKFWNKYKINIIIYLAVAVFLSATLFVGDKLTHALSLRPTMPNNDVTSVHIVDVGQASCALVHFATGEDLIIDSGSASSNKKLISYINNVFFLHGDKTFEYAILTHSDSDHCGNFSYILNNYKIGVFYRPNIISTLAGESAEIGEAYIDSENYVYADVIKTLNAHNNVQVVKNKADLQIKNNDITLLTMYSPQYDVYDNVNDYSPVMVLGDNNLKVCITGDASKNIENFVVNSYDLPDIDVLVLGHHGSNTSTSYEFIEALQPERVAISVGENSYGHPSTETFDTLNLYDTNYDKYTLESKNMTISDGNIIYYSTNDGYEVITINNIDNYLHVDYWVLVVISYGVLLIIFVKPIKRSGRRYSKNS